MKIKIEIKSWLNGSVLFEFEKENNTIKDTLVEAVKRGANLWRADLWRANLWEANLWEANLWEANLQEANLQGANLQGANLRGADLQGAKNIEGDYTDFWWHVHHEVLVEQLTEPLRARINYIKANKPKNEIETRLKLLKPVLGQIPTTEKGWERLHKKECEKDCPWLKGQGTIFPKRI